jgi:hypothetical protein
MATVFGLLVLAARALVLCAALALAIPTALLCATTVLLLACATAGICEGLPRPQDLRFRRTSAPAHDRDWSRSPIIDGQCSVISVRPL